MENKVVIISELQSYLVLSLKEKMQDAGWSVDCIAADINEISRYAKGTDAFLIYCDETIVEDQNLLHYIKDTANENDILIFATGEEEELTEVEKHVTKSLLRRKFLRPINVNELIKDVEEDINQFGGKVKKKVLVVDDSGAMLRNVKGWLEDKYQVILANSGAMAIKYLATNRPDLVLLDYEMPVIDGKQVLEMIRTETEFKDVPVIFLTSKGDKESVLQVMSLKPEGYLLKTLPPEKIIESVDEFFLKQKMMKS